MLHLFIKDLSSAGQKFFEHTRKLYLIFLGKASEQLDRVPQLGQGYQPYIFHSIGAESLHDPEDLFHEGPARFVVDILKPSAENLFHIDTVTGAD